MLWVILFPVILVIFSWKQIYRMADEFMEYILMTVVLAFFACVACGVGIIFAMVIGRAVPQHWSEPEVIQLVSLRSNTGLNGTFYLGTGSIASTEYYFYYKKAGEGYRPGKVNTSEDVTVFETQKPAGVLKIYTQKFSSSRYIWIALMIPSERYEFYIPRGTIARNFVLQ